MVSYGQTVASWNTAHLIHTSSSTEQNMQMTANFFQEVLSSLKNFLQKESYWNQSSEVQRLIALDLHFPSQ